MSNKLVKSNVKNRDIYTETPTVSYRIRAKGSGEILGILKFNPADTNIIDRYKEVAKYYENYKMPEKTGNLDEDIENIKKAENDIVDKISYLINSDSREAFFNSVGAFTVMEDGELFVEKALSAIATAIEKEMNVRTQKLKKRMNKYVAKYHN